MLRFVLLSLVLYKNLSGVSYSVPRHFRGLSSLCYTLTTAEKPIFFFTHCVTWPPSVLCYTWGPGNLYWEWWELCGLGPTSLGSLRVLPLPRVLPRKRGRTVLLADPEASAPTIVCSLSTSPLFVSTVF